MMDGSQRFIDKSTGECRDQNGGGHIEHIFH